LIQRLRQWAYLSGLGRLSPEEVSRLARRLGRARVGAEVDRLRSPTSTRIAVQPPAAVRARLDTTITVDGTDLVSALLASPNATSRAPLEPGPTRTPPASAAGRRAGAASRTPEPPAAVASSSGHWVEHVLAGRAYARKRDELTQP
jgi:hypothetical protein